MTRQVGARRAGVPAEHAHQRTLYARVLGLQFVNPPGWLCALFFEATIALGTLLALAELAGWWAVVVLPATVAAMVKVNDVVAGALVPTGGSPAGRVP